MSDFFVRDANGKADWHATVTKEMLELCLKQTSKTITKALEKSGKAEA